jgi:hypothetical protein
MQATQQAHRKLDPKGENQLLCADTPQQHTGTITHNVSNTKGRALVSCASGVLWWGHMPS